VKGIDAYCYICVTREMSARLLKRGSRVADCVCSAQEVCSGAYPPYPGPCLPLRGYRLRNKAPDKFSPSKMPAVIYSLFAYCLVARRE
jgi:hypothetical protein